MPNLNLQIKKLDIVLLAKSHNPTILNPDFLKYNSIVPPDWQLAGPPVCVEPVARVEFQNKVSISSEPERVIFSQSLETNSDLANIRINEISKNYAKTVPHVSYTAVGINPKMHIAFGSKEEAAEFITKTFIKPGPWSKYQFSAGVTFSFDLGDTALNVNLKTAIYNAPEDKKIPVVLFSFNFHHAVKKKNTKDTDDRLEEIFNLIDNWPRDIDFIFDFVKNIE